MDLSLQSAFLAEMSTLLILLAGAVLLYSSFREKYLVPWIAGWSMFTVYKVFLALSAAQPQGAAVGRSWLMPRMCWQWGCLQRRFFFMFHNEKLVWPRPWPWASALPLEIAYSLWRPYPALHYIAFALCWLVSIMASDTACPLCLGKSEYWPLAAGGMLVLLHLDTVGSVHQVVGTDLVVDLLLGIGMMTIVLEDSRIQVQRLDALNTITHQISDSREFESHGRHHSGRAAEDHAGQSRMVPHAAGEKLAMAAHTRAVAGIC